MNTSEIMAKTEDVVRRAIQLGAHLGDVAFDEVLLANGFTEEERMLAIAYTMGRQHEDLQKGQKPQIDWPKGEA